jgi:hypothetical protein
MNSDLWYYLSVFLDISDILSCSIINKEIYMIFSKTKMYQEHILLNKKCDFIKIPDLDLLEYHIKSLMNLKIKDNFDRFIYYTVLCVSFNSNLDRLTDLLTKIFSYAKTPKLIQQITRNIICKVTNVECIKIIIEKNKFFIYEIAMENNNYDVLYYVINKYEHIFGTSFYKSILKYYNSTALKILLDLKQVHCNHIISISNDNLWIDKNKKFTEILYSYALKNQYSLHLFAHEMLLFYCKYNTLDDIKGSILNDILLLEKISLTDGFCECINNDNGYDIMIWLSEIISASQYDVIKIFDKMLFNNNVKMINYWKDRYEITIKNYYKNITTKQLSAYLDYKKSFHFISEYFEQIKILKIIGEKWKNILSKNNIYSQNLEMYSDDMTQFLYDNLNFDAIDHNLHIYIIHFFLYLDNYLFLNKYIEYETEISKKKTTLIELLSLVNKYNKNQKINGEISRILASYYD